MPQPRGSSDYIRTLKNRAIASSYAPKQGISLDASTLLAARTGQLPQVVQPIHGQPYDVSGCCCVPPSENINLVASIATPITPVDGFTYMATVSWDDIGATYYTLSLEYENSSTNAYSTVFGAEPTTVTVLFETNPGAYTAQVISHKPCGEATTTATANID